VVTVGVTCNFHHLFHETALRPTVSLRNLFIIFRVLFQLRGCEVNTTLVSSQLDIRFSKTFCILAKMSGRELKNKSLYPHFWSAGNNTRTLGGFQGAASCQFQL